MPDKDRIHLNPSKKFLKDLEELKEFLGLKDTRGDNPKTLQFSLAFTLEMLHFYKKVTLHSFIYKINKFLSSNHPLKNLTSLEELLERLKERP